MLLYFAVDTSLCYCRPTVGLHVVSACQLTGPTDLYLLST